MRAPHSADRARGADPARIFDALSRRLMNKLIHAPIKALRADEELVRFVPAALPV